MFLFFALGGTNVANIPSGQSNRSVYADLILVTTRTDLRSPSPSFAVSITGDVNTSQIQFIALAFGFSLGE